MVFQSRNLIALYGWACTHSFPSMGDFVMGLTVKEDGLLAYKQFFFLIIICHLQIVNDSENYRLSLCVPSLAFLHLLLTLYNHHLLASPCNHFTFFWVLPVRIPTKFNELGKSPWKLLISMTTRVFEGSAAKWPFSTGAWRLLQKIRSPKLAPAHAVLYHAAPLWSNNEDPNSQKTSFS